MAKDYTLPKLAMAMNEGTINEWLVEEGVHIERGEAIATVETEKTVYDLEAPDSGYLHISLPAGETVDCGTLIGQFAESESELAELQQVKLSPKAEVAAVEPTTEAAPASTATVAAPSRKPGARINASPVVRKMAGERNVDLALITGTGTGGRVVKRDILAAVESSANSPMAPVMTDGRVEKARIPMKGARKTIADRMMQSLNSTAQLSSFWESDITDLLALRRELVEREEALGTPVSVNAFLVKAIVYGVRQVPIANACLEGDDTVIFDNVNVGVAVSMPGQTEYDSSLLVPVLHNVEDLDLVEINRRMQALVTRVREGQHTEDDLTGSTITLSSTAGIAPPGNRSTPVLNLPNAVLVGPSTPIEKPCVVNGEVVPRTLLPMSVTFDHRILDGELAVRFMSAVHECLENPELLMS